VDGVALRDPDAAVDGQCGAGVARRVTTRVRGDVVFAAKRWRDDGNGTAIDRDGASAFGEFLKPGWCGVDMRSDAMSELFRDRRGCGERDGEKQQSVRPSLQSGGGLAVSGGLKACRDLRGVERLHDSAIAENLDFFWRNRAAGEIGE